MGGFSLLAQGTRVLGGQTRFEDATFRPGGETVVSDSKRSRKQHKESRIAGTVVSDYSDDDWARIVGTRIGFMFQNLVGSWTPDLVIVEEGPVAEIYYHPKHPYTAGLVGSIPGIRPGRLRSIRGEAPRLVDVDRTQCVFADRCDFVTEICHMSQPEPRPVGETMVACHHATPDGHAGIRG